MYCSMCTKPRADVPSFRKRPSTFVVPSSAHRSPGLPNAVTIQSEWCCSSCVCSTDSLSPLLNGPGDSVTQMNVCFGAGLIAMELQLRPIGCAVERGELFGDGVEHRVRVVRDVKSRARRITGARSHRAEVAPRARKQKVRLFVALNMARPSSWVSESSSGCAMAIFNSRSAALSTIKVPQPLSILPLPSTSPTSIRTQYCLPLDSSVKLRTPNAVVSVGPSVTLVHGPVSMARAANRKSARSASFGMTYTPCGSACPIGPRCTPGAPRACVCQDTSIRRPAPCSGSSRQRPG